MDKKVDLYMPVRGELMPLQEVNNYLVDDMVDGLGVAILPEEDIFYAVVWLPFSLCLVADCGFGSRILSSPRTSESGKRTDSL